LRFLLQTKRGGRITVSTKLRNKKTKYLIAATILPKWFADFLSALARLGNTCVADALPMFSRPFLAAFVRRA
jgi:hypothetical protein